MLPGVYELRVTGNAGGVLPAVSRQLRLAAPREGVVSSASMSTRLHGPDLLRVSRAKSLYVTFVFAPAGRPKQKKLRAFWYEPGRQPAALPRGEGLPGGGREATLCPVLVGQRLPKPNASRESFHDAGRGPTRRMGGRSGVAAHSL